MTDRLNSFLLALDDLGFSATRQPMAPDSSIDFFYELRRQGIQIRAGRDRGQEFVVISPNKEDGFVPSTWHAYLKGELDVQAGVFPDQFELALAILPLLQKAIDDDSKIASHLKEWNETLLEARRRPL